MKQSIDSGRSWYDNSDWSDLIIELSDGRKITVHKSVLCTRNKYFDALCGLRSQFAVSPNQTCALSRTQANITGGAAKGDQI